MRRHRSILFILLGCAAFLSPIEAESLLPENYQELTTDLEQTTEPLDLSPFVEPALDLADLEAKAKKNYSGETPDKRENHSYSRNSSKRDTEKKEKSWKPRFEEIQVYRHEKNFIFRTDIGLGLLYFSGVSGRFVGVPNDLFDATNSHFRGTLGYNRTPVYDFFLGYHFFPWLQTGLAYTHQGNVTVYTNNIATDTSIANAVASTQFSSNLNLDALSFRIYANSPWPLLWRSIAFNTYLGTGVGIGWQSWTANQFLTSTESGNIGLGSYQSFVLPFRQKISPNCYWGADVGIQIQKLTACNHFSMSAGVKFNLWGQALNIGELDQQGPMKFGLAGPFRIKTVYQWAPYLSAQWNFSNGNILKTKLYKKSELSPLLTQMNVGIGFLKFKNIRGNLIAQPNQNGLTNNGWQSARVPQNISYNRTPLYEFLLQHRFNNFAQIGISYQNQGGICIQTQATTTLANPTAMFADYAQLNAYLNLNAILAKGYLLYPIFTHNRSISLTPYFGLGFGPSWQTWGRISVYRTGYDTTQPIYVNGPQSLRQKISANVMLALDWGLKITSLHQKNYFSLVAGCKYNYWGQAKNIGLQSQQGSYSTGLNAPFTIQRVYQWAPYLGVQWNFPNNYYGNKPYYLEGQDPRSWKPFCVDMDLIQKSKGMFTQMNVGLGLLYFRGVRGNLAGLPSNQVYRSIATSAPVRGRLTYNRTPLFEYQVGYRFFPMLKASFSYQHQGNVTVQTKMIRNQAPSTLAVQNQYSQLSADVVLDAFMVKAFIESPRAFIWRNTATTGYFAGGLGASWQTWKRVFLNNPVVSQGNLSEIVTSFKQKISANVAFMFDAGLRIQSPYPHTGFSALVGCKFNFWGQAREMGSIQEQPTLKHGLVKPFSVLTVYQWAPYLGVQWNF